ncbi:hypothetical protein ACROYT_G036495 [Oculina patagonica]
MDPIKFCIILCVLLAVTSFLFVLGASENSSTAQAAAQPSSTLSATSQLQPSSTAQPVPSPSSSATAQPRPPTTPKNFLSFDNGNYNMSWMFNRSMDTLHFLVQVKTTGWIGFGIASQAPNNMMGYDVAVGGVLNGAGYLKDYLTVGRKQPQLDSQQDWNLTYAKEENGVTTLKFYRQRDTSDSVNDTVIQVKMVPFDNSTETPFTV